MTCGTYTHWRDKTPTWGTVLEKDKSPSDEVKRYHPAQRLKNIKAKQNKNIVCDKDSHASKCILSALSRKTPSFTRPAFFYKDAPLCLELAQTEPKGSSYLLGGVASPLVDKTY